MKTLHLISDLSGGGAERQLAYLAPGLAARGHQVHVGYLNAGEFMPSLPGVELTRFSAWSNHDPGLVLQIGRLIRRIRPDVVQTWILQMDVMGGLASAWRGTPWVLREPSSALAYVPQTWKNGLRVQVARTADAIICNSHGGDEYWRGLLPRKPRYVVRNGIPVGEIDSEASSMPPFPGPSDRYVLYVGRLSSDGTASKNLSELLHAIAAVRREADVSAVLCGDGPQKEELVALRESLGLGDRVVFTGHVPPAAVWSLMKRAAVFVSLSAYEGCPNAVMEAMVCGSPLVLSDIPAHREIADESSAVFVNPNDKAATADAILRLLRDRDGAIALRKSARKRVELWSTEKMVDGFERIYEGLG